MFAKDYNITKQWIENIIQPQSTITASASWANGTDNTVTITSTPLSGALCMTEPNISVYIDSVSTTNSLFNSGFDISHWQIVGPFYDYHTTGDVVVTGPATSVTKFRIRNIDAGTHTLIIKARVRIIQDSVTVTGTAAGS